MKNKVHKCFKPNIHTKKDIVGPLGVQYLAQRYFDTQGCTPEPPEIKPLTFWDENPLYLLSHSHPINNNYVMFVTMSQSWDVTGNSTWAWWRKSYDLCLFCRHRTWIPSSHLVNHVFLCIPKYSAVECESVQQPKLGFSGQTNWIM